MARLPYIEEQDHPELSGLIAQIRAERGGQLPDPYKMLLYSPPIAAGWLQLLTAIRQQCQLCGKLRELAILRVGILNRASYEYQAHIPFALKEGLSQDQIESLSNWRESSLFDSRERAMLAYTDDMTKEIHVPEEIFCALREHFNDQQLVELTATIAAYNLVSRFLEALQIHPK